MELALNLGWMVLTALMCGLWLYHAPAKGASRRTQLIALAVVVLIMLPVISVTDDILMAQNPAETDCYQRKDHAGTSGHPTVHPVANTILLFFVPPSSDSFQSAALGNPLAPVVKVPATDSIQNRPPPAA
jgi:hypothetical protein